MADSNKKRSSSSKKKPSTGVKKTARKKTSVKKNTSGKPSPKKKKDSTARKKKTSPAGKKKVSRKTSATSRKKNTVKRKHVSPEELAGFTYASAIKKKDFPRKKTLSKKAADKYALKGVRVGTALILSVFFFFLFTRGIVNHFKKAEYKAPSSAETTYKKKQEPSKKTKKPQKPHRAAVTPVCEKEKPYIVFVLDDIGYTRKHEDILKDLGESVTYAVLPLVNYSGYFSDLARKTGAELILHLPIESLKGNEPDPGLLRPDMSTKEIVAQLYTDISSVPGIAGINNHKGSLGTTDVRLMRIVLSRIREENIFFLDSYTNPDSVAARLCLEMKVPYLRRDVFLDNDNDPASIRRQINKLVAVSEKKGYAIGIGHYRPNTLKMLSYAIPELKEEGYRITSLEKLLHEKGLKLIR